MTDPAKSALIQRACECEQKRKHGIATRLDLLTILAAMLWVRVLIARQHRLADWYTMRAGLMILKLYAQATLSRLRSWCMAAFIYAVTSLRGH